MVEEAFAQASLSWRDLLGSRYPAQAPCVCSSSFCAHRIGACCAWLRRRSANCWLAPRAMCAGVRTRATASKRLAARWLHCTRTTRTPASSLWVRLRLRVLTVRSGSMGPTHRGQSQTHLGPAVGDRGLIRRQLSQTHPAPAVDECS